MVDQRVGLYLASQGQSEHGYKVWRWKVPFGFCEAFVLTVVIPGSWSWILLAESWKKSSREPLVLEILV
jgi:hypothetical protein